VGSSKLSHFHIPLFFFCLFHITYILNIKNMQHYALFRFQAGKTLGALSADPRGAACTLFPSSGGIKIAALLGRHLTPRLDLNGANIRRIFETCKHFRYFLREFKK
jgi:hypothetical protein